MNSNWKHTEKIQIRFADIDPYGHVNNSVYISYFEVARTNALLNEFYEYSDKGLNIIVKTVNCEYKKPIFHKSNCYATVTLKQVKKASFSFEYFLHDEFDGGNIFAQGTTRHCVLNSHTNKLEPVNDLIQKLHNKSETR